MKCKVAFVSKKMDTGGIEKAALSILSHLKEAEFDVDYYYRKRGHENLGELFDQIPQWVSTYEIKSINIKNYKEYYSSFVHRVHFWINYIKAYIKQNSDWGKQYSLQAKLSAPGKQRYDLSIAFDGPKAFGIFYAAEQIDAKIKILWIHGDVQKERADTNLVRKYYHMFDHIVTVSEASKEILLKVFPELEPKVRVIYNYVDATGIRQKAKEGIATPFENYRGVKITTAGRLGPDKGMLMAAECCKMLVDRHIDVKWVLCGDGPEREKIEKYVQENKLRNNFILVGNQSNPYPYINACDIYVQPSIQEGFCTTTNEAKVLCKPVVTTDVCGMREQFEHLENGVVVEVSSRAIFEGIMRLLEDHALYKNIIGSLTNVDWGNQTDYNKLLRGFAYGTAD